MARYARAPDDANSLHNHAVLTIFRDREGIIWLGTQSGLSRFQEKPPPFVNYGLVAPNGGQQNDNHIWSLQGDSQGFVWFGTQAGLYRLDRKNRRITEYRHDARNTYSLSAGPVTAIREGRDGDLWVASREVSTGLTTPGGDSSATGTTQRTLTV